MSEVKAKIDHLRTMHKSDAMLSDNLKKDAAGRVEEVLCWLCKTPVAGYVDTDVVHSGMRDGKPIIKVRQVFAPYNNYRKVGFTLKSGSYYSPVFCSDCAPTVNLNIGKMVLERDAVLAFDKPNGEATAEMFLKDDVVEYKGVA